MLFGAEENIKLRCDNCKGITEINIIKNKEKVTLPIIEFCPLCGMYR